MTGRVISSKRGELSVLATSWVLASKALRPLPTLHKELGEETRVRQRYADLVARPEARDMVRTRALVTHAIREVLHDEGYIELETPVLQLVHGGAAARPFRTHLNAFDIDMTLRIALELYLKRAMVGGRRPGLRDRTDLPQRRAIDSSHSAEFTMLEAYQAWGDQTTIAMMTQRLIQHGRRRRAGHPHDRHPGRRDRPGRGVGLEAGLPDAVGSSGRGDHPGHGRRPPARHRRGPRHRARPRLG